MLWCPFAELEGIDRVPIDDAFFIIIFVLWNSCFNQVILHETFWIIAIRNIHYYILNLYNQLMQCKN